MNESAGVIDGCSTASAVCRRVFALKVSAHYQKAASGPFQQGQT